MSRASAYAPGRVELLGNHTDYNDGLVLAAAIDRGTTISGRALDNSAIVLHSTTLGRTARASANSIARDADEPWANYPLGVARALISRGFAIRGFEAEITSDLPAGSGLSSSAALEVATAYFLAALFHFNLEPRDAAQLCREAENDFVGVASGMLDQITSVFGRADHVVYLDCRSGEIRAIGLGAGLALVIADSGAKHSLLQSQYNQRRAECAAAADALGVRSLRDVSSAQVAASNIEDVLRRRALHITGENERVERAAGLLASRRGAEIGELMNASHESSRVNFENSTAELDMLASIARSLPGVLGSRLTGGGFGGSTVTLVHADRAAAVAMELSQEFRSRTGCDPRAFVCRLADGAAILNSH